MIDGKAYINTVKDYFSFLTTEFQFKCFQEVIQGNYYYEVVYERIDKRISISYENAEDYLQVIVFLLEKGKLPIYDDKTRTLHLEILNKNILTRLEKKEIILSNQSFKVAHPQNKLEEKLLKSAKELRINLKHLDKTEI